MGIRNVAVALALSSCVVLWAQPASASVATGPIVDQQQSRAYQAGFERGLTEGRQAGRADKTRNTWNLEKQHELIVANAGYQPAYGSIDEYRDGFRAGFRAGYRETFGPAPAGTSGTAARESHAKTAAYKAGYQRGLTEGKKAGSEDKRLRNKWDLEGQRELERADSGFDSKVGSREEYQEGYRAGFRLGYARGFGPRDR